VQERGEPQPLILWVANPSPYDSFIHYTSPVYPAHRRTKPCANVTLPLTWPDLEP
jgi:hypothetical protein